MAVEITLTLDDGDDSYVIFKESYEQVKQIIQEAIAYPLFSVPPTKIRDDSEGRKEMTKWNTDLKAAPFETKLILTLDSNGERWAVMGLRPLSFKDTQNPVFSDFEDEDLLKNIVAWKLMPEPYMGEI